MALSCNRQCIKLMIYSFIFYLLVLSLLPFSDAASEEPIVRGRKLSPFDQRLVVISNGVANKEVINVHCRSSEDDLGLKHIRYGSSWGFSFRVNWKGTTKFRCHITWRGGGDHWFTIFKDRRDKCDTCEWTVKGDGRDGKPMRRERWNNGLPANEYPAYFDWDK